MVPRTPMTNSTISAKIKGIFSSPLAYWGHLNRNSVDESQTEMNIRVSPALLQDRREVRTATSTSGNPNGV